MSRRRRDSDDFDQTLQMERQLESFKEPDILWDKRHKVPKRSNTLLGELALRETIGQAPWPKMSRFYDPLTMDATQISSLLLHDTQFTDDTFPWFLEHASYSDGIAKIHQTSADNVHADGLFSKSVLESPLTIIHVAQERLYFKSDTISAVSVDAKTWTTMLQQFEIIPSFLELAHSNQGGSFSYISYGRTGSSPEGSDVHDTPQAFHVGYRIGSWGRPGLAIYARRDFVTGRVLVLFLGTTASIRLSRLQDLLAPGLSVDLFHVVLMLQSLMLDAVEETRWKVDYRTQALESETGVTIVHMHEVQPLDSEELKFNKSLHAVAEFAMFVAGGSARLRSSFSAMLYHLSVYEKVCAIVSGCEVKRGVLDNLRSICATKLSLVQYQHDHIQELRQRLEAQLAITKTLVAQRDTLLQIDIAKASKRDNEFMQGIAVVTMIFLPGTFTATFFSMVFFHVGNESSIHLMVDNHLWYYPAAALPLTVLFAIWYFAWTTNWLQSRFRRISRHADGGNNIETQTKAERTNSGRQHSQQSAESDQSAS
jgi:hypothetical protein